MKIAFVTDCFPPYAPGGAEWSSFYLAKDLYKKGEKVLVLTPNLGSNRYETIDGVKIIRFPFYLKSKSQKVIPGNFSYTNPLWFLWVFIASLYFLNKEKVDLIHIQGKYSIPPVVLANFILQKPIIATIRDYFVICSYGICLMSGDKKCNLNDYFKKDFIKYWDIYVKDKNLYTLFLNLIFAIWGRFATNYVKYFANKCQIVVLSKKQKDIFVKNGFSDVKVIGNSISFMNKLFKYKRSNLVLFAGRLTFGKGAYLIIDILGEFFKKFPEFKFAFIGDGDAKEKLYRYKKIYKNIIIQNQIPHRELMGRYKKSLVTLMPSVWPEPFGRVALESISVGTPAVVTDRGGLPEIVRNNRWGIVVKPNTLDLLKGLEKAIEKNEEFQKNISEDYEMIKLKFGTGVVDKYLRIYKESLR